MKAAVREAVALARKNHRETCGLLIDSGYADRVETEVVAGLKRLGLDPASVLFVPHHLAHAASAYLAAPFDRSAVMVLDGRGERTSYLSGVARDGE